MKDLEIGVKEKILSTQRERALKVMELLFQKLGNQLYPYQKRLCENPARNKIVNKSRQIGISYVVSCWAYIQASCFSRIELAVSPSLRQSKLITHNLYSFHNVMRQAFPQITRMVTEETKTSIIFSHGGQVHSLPNSPNTVRGFRGHDIYFDEFAHFLHGTDQEMVEAVLPSTLRGGNTWYISTPFGDQNLYHDYWTNAKTRGLETFTFNWRECPDMTQKKLNELKLLYPDGQAWDQEMENQFYKDTGETEFPFSLIEKCIQPDLEYYPMVYHEGLEIDIPQMERDKIYYGGVDIGRMKDLTAFLALNRVDDNFILKAKKTFYQTPYKNQQEFFEFMLNNYTFDKFNMDQSGIGDMLVEEIYRNFDITGYKFDNELKQNLVNNLKTLMQNGKIKIPNDAQLINSIRAIKRMYTPTNYLRFDSERDSEIGHADLFWALALAVYIGESGTTDFIIE